MNACLCSGLLVALLSVASWPLSAADTQLLRHVQGLSRDYYYLNIESPAQPFQVQDIVGGEHENQYFILGFAGDQFSIAIDSLEGDAGYSLGGEGYQAQQQAEGDHVLVEQPHTWIRIQVSAHPYAEYRLRVKKYE
ncbi:MULTISPECIES: hypothetical protein [unclassified Agarivorans]|uniref:hypothetical protein n=1 Tax=unclassified Agarivorans TaxID=2636026 RepID=UPI003D7D8BEB